MSWLLRNLPIYSFYVVAGLLISTYLHFHKEKLSMSIAISMLVVFVSSEFWELPRFISAYLNGLHVEVLNHIIVLFMAFLLVVYTNFKLSKKNAVLLLSNLGFNSIVFWLPFPLHDWILRSLTLTCLVYVFVLETWKNG